MANTIFGGAASGAPVPVGLQKIPAAQDVPTRAVPAALEELALALSRLHEEMGALEGVTRPYRMEVPAEEPGGMPVDPGMSPIGLQVHGLREQVVRLTALAIWIRSGF